MRGAEGLPVDILTLPFPSAESSSLICISLPARPGLQNKTHSTLEPFLMSHHRKHRETGSSGCSAVMGFGLTFLLCPKQFNRPNLGFRICKQASEFCMPLFLWRAVLTGSSLAWDCSVWALRHEDWQPCCLLPASVSALSQQSTAIAGGLLWRTMSSSSNDSRVTEEQTPCAPQSCSPQLPKHGWMLLAGGWQGV